MDPISERLRTRHPQRIDLSLDRMRALCAALGDPQDRMPPVIHVAGTNGKGSTVAFIRAIAEAAGLKVHAYTSPHLVRFNERIRLAGRLIEDAAGDAEVVIPGHGSVGGAGAVRARIDRDRAYLEALRDGRTPDDPRIGPSARPGWEWVAGLHDGQRQRLGAGD